VDPVRNPYVPGAGTPPPTLTGREDVLEKARITLARISQGKPSKSFMLVGLRGVGKTVLLNRILGMAEDSGDKTTYIEAHEDKSFSQLLAPRLR
jgi:Cdc6-like AAA superfamily ATPase